MKLSVVLISFNEETNIKRTLDAVKMIADEIIVVDSYSTDATTEVAAKAGAKVVLHEWEGFVAQKNFALQQCKGEWILSLDCDEVVSEELAQQIRRAVGTEGINGYALNRKTFYLGKKLNYAWQPDKKLRLVRNDASPVWKGGDVHEYLCVNGSISALTGDLIHYSYRDFSDHMYKTVKYAELSAKSYYKKGRRSSRFKIISRPLFALFARLVIKRAVLDGIQGVISAFSSSFYVYMKYSFLWEIQNARKND